MVTEEEMRTLNHEQHLLDVWHRIDSRLRSLDNDWPTDPTKQAHRVSYVHHLARMLASSVGCMPQVWCKSSIRETPFVRVYPHEVYTDDQIAKLYAEYKQAYANPSRDIFVPRFDEYLEPVVVVV